MVRDDGIRDDIRKGRFVVGSTAEDRRVLGTNQAGTVCRDRRAGRAAQAKTLGMRNIPRRPLNKTAVCTEICTTIIK